MSDPQDPNAPQGAPQEAPSATAGDEFREGVTHLITAARKFASGIEPQVQRSLEEAESALERLGREGESAVSDVTREVASFAERLAAKLREAAERKDNAAPKG